MWLLVLGGCLFNHDYLDWVYTQLEDDDLDGFREIDGDCDDRNADVHPDVDEVCDGIDNDCSGDTDGDALDIRPWYQDRDQDGYGIAAVTRLSCEPVPTYATQDGDCNDEDAAVHPDAEVVCGEAGDVDCDGVEEDLDQDHDGSPWCDDCNDYDPSVNPQKIERCNEEDDDCDGQVDEEGALLSIWYPDVDGDDYGNTVAGLESCERPAGYYTLQGGDCNDDEYEINPDAMEVCNNGIDDNCNQQVDSCLLPLDLESTASFIGTADFAIGQDPALNDLVNAGDLDGDGDDELAFVKSGQVVIQAAPFVRVEQPVESAAHVSVTSSASDFGLLVVPVGDLDEDGREEVAISSPFDGQGSVYLIGGEQGELQAEDLRMLTGPTTDSLFGFGILTGALLDPDQRHMLISTGSIAENRSTTYALSLPLAENPNMEEVLQTEAGEGMMGAVSYVLDANGDGQDDLATLPFFWNTQGSQVTLPDMRIYFGPVLRNRAADVDVQITAAAASAIGGVQVVVADASGDGLSDLWFIDGSNAYLVQANQSGVASDLKLAAVIGHSEDQVIDSLVAEDINGDQQADLFVGYPRSERGGWAGLYYGPFSGTLDSHSYQAAVVGAADSWTGRWLAVGMFDVSPALDLAVATPGVEETWSAETTRVDIYGDRL